MAAIYRPAIYCHHVNLNCRGYIKSSGQGDNINIGHYGTINYGEIRSGWSSNKAT